MTVAETSCLRRNQSGLVNPAPLEIQEAEQIIRDEAARLGLDVARELPAGVTDDERGSAVRGELYVPLYIAVPDEYIEELYSAAELDAAMRLGVAPPRWTRIYQARAATWQRRSPESIRYVVLHTPEGSESGTLSVLSGGRAGFDVFHPVSGARYKCNDFFAAIAWQAGDWPYNQASVGNEQGDYASRSGSWGDRFYDAIAYDNAWLGEVCNVPVANGRRGTPGYIDHAEITPWARSDPGAGYRREYMLQKVADIRGGRVSPVDPTPTQPAAPKKVYIVNDPKTRYAKYAKACEAAMEAVGMKPEVIDDYRKVEDIRWASYQARMGRLGEYVCIIGDPGVVNDLHPKARETLRDENGKWYPPDVSDLWDCISEQRQKYRWRIATLCQRASLDENKALKVYEELLT